MWPFKKKEKKFFTLNDFERFKMEYTQEISRQVTKEINELFKTSSEELYYDGAPVYHFKDKRMSSMIRREVNLHVDRRIREFRGELRKAIIKAESDEYIKLIIKKINEFQLVKGE